ncbi:PDR/VanB family oxidoreductase [Herbaspirillum rhizosphaerae]|uniref:PDR/VanB family oxidoreductase n=1 Tax=Herbaspirillum rhizosphaerae TaxID=346179 RepID=UPI00067B9419|nr:PDR/VanB family oxidoreductase [Herbaspirillum rhizosphaerae]
MTAVHDAFMTAAQTAAPLRLRVAAVRADGCDIRVFDLYADDARSLPAWTPGAHIKLSLPGGLERCYSLCNTPGDDGFYRIAVKRETASRGGSAWLHAQAGVGTQLSAGAPVNAFPLYDSEHPAALFAAGIGITPIYAMAADLLHRGRAAQLHYFARSVEHVAFLSQLSQPVMAGHCHFRFGLHADDVAAAVAAKLTLLPRTTPLYVCGPAPFIAQVREQAAQLGWRDADVHFELFAAATSAADTSATQDRAFELVLQRSGVQCMVQPGQSIVAAAAEAGVQIGTSCGEGFCGSCQTGVLEGAPDHLDSVLTERERAAGHYLMPCVSRCRGERLVLDI